MHFTADDVYALAPYARTLGVAFDQLEPDAVRARLEFSEDLSTAGRALHGGALMGLADVAAAVCAVANAAAGALPATMQSSTNFMRPVRGTARATARPLHVGRTSVVVEVDILDDDGRLCVRVEQTVAVRNS